MPRPRTSGLDRQLRVSTRALLVVVVVIPNIIGIGVVLGLAGWIFPLTALVTDPNDGLTRNVLAAVAYGSGAVLIGAWWGHRRMRIPRLPADPDEVTLRKHRKRVRKVVLRGPVRLVTVQAVLWAGGVVTFVLLNIFSSVRVGLTVALVVTLGGITVVAVTYRFCEIVLRHEVARVLAERPPSGRGLPGVAVRAVGAWGLGTAVPLFGLVLAAASSLIFGGYSMERLALVVLVLGGIALVVGFLVTVLTATSTAAPVVAVRRALRRVERGDYDVEISVFDTTELGLLQAGFNTMVEGLRERERVRDLFGRHVGEDVARTALENEVELGGEVREVAVLFVDLIGSTNLAANRPPTEVVEILNRFFAVVIDTVERHDGWINKFEGDAALAIFGAPTGLDDAAGCALRAGRELAARLVDEIDDVSAGIGVSAGEAVAGNIGDTRRYEYTVIGDPVNEAARLTAAAKECAGRVVASGATLERAGGDEAARWRVVGSRNLRGRDAGTDLAVPAEHAPADEHAPLDEPHEHADVAGEVTDSGRGVPSLG